MSLIDLAERGWLPDGLIRVGIRRLLARRLRQETGSDVTARRAATSAFIDQLRAGSLAVFTRAANEQHYEVPAEFFRDVLGPRLKYSCCLFESQSDDLAHAEERMLRQTAERAEIVDGMEILELGCGWGSLTLWLAEHFPRSRITAVSNSHGQRQFIEGRCRDRGYDRVQVITQDMGEFATDRRFDRVVSIEMFEHMRNYGQLLERIAGWLKPDGKLFVHIFCHRDTPYFFETAGADDWMGRHFFTGGIMPSDDLLLHFPDHLAIERHWSVDGRQYARTCESWLARLDSNRKSLLDLFAKSQGAEAPRVLQRWRIFFMACAELFRYRRGSEWFVSHYLFRNRDAGVTRERIVSAQ